MCKSPRNHGDYNFPDYVVEFPNYEAGQTNAIAPAIFTSFHVNMALVTQRATAEAAPHIAHLKQVDAQQRPAVQANTANPSTTFSDRREGHRPDERDRGRQQRPAGRLECPAESQRAERSGLQQLSAGPKRDSEQQHWRAYEMELGCGCDGEVESDQVLVRE